MKKTALLFSLLLFSLNAAADPNRNNNGRGNDRQRNGQQRYQQRQPNQQQPNNGWQNGQQGRRNNGQFNNQRQDWRRHDGGFNNGRQNTGRHNNGWQNNWPNNPPPPPQQTFRYPNRIYTPIYRAPYGARPNGYVWYNGNWCPPPAIRYPYNRIAWNALTGVIAYFSYQVPAPARWACVVSMNGDVVSVGHGVDPTEAQQIALLNCDRGGYNCAYNYYAMDCAPR